VICFQAAVPSAEINTNEGILELICHGMKKGCFRLIFGGIILEDRPANQHAVGKEDEKLIDIRDCVYHHDREVKFGPLNCRFIPTFLQIPDGPSRSEFLSLLLGQGAIC
jgi:hypothetical protein